MQETKVIAMDTAKDMVELQEEQLKREAIAAELQEDAKMSEYEKLQARAKAMMKPFVMQLEAYEIPDEKLEAVIDYATILYAKNYRYMKEQRMLRKIVEYFKLKSKNPEHASH